MIIPVVVSEKISAQNDTLKIRKSSISRMESYVITWKAYFGHSRQIYTIPENFMKIRPGVLEKASKKKKEWIREKCSKNNNKVFRLENGRP